MNWIVLLLQILLFVFFVFISIIIIRAVIKYINK
ncbi:hypothetical protein HNQ56_003077 [Anaerotaenia torta]